MATSFAVVASVDHYQAVDDQTVVVRPKFGAGLITLNFDSRQELIEFCNVILEECNKTVPVAATPPRLTRAAAAAAAAKEAAAVPLVDTPIGVESVYDASDDDATVGADEILGTSAEKEVAKEAKEEADKNPYALTLDEEGRDIFDIAHDEMLAAGVRRMRVDPLANKDNDDSFEDDYAVSQELW